MNIDLKIRNCNNIIEGNITIFKNELNIKYGINGTGKSTIANAIYLFARGEDVDSELHTFGSEKTSSVECNLCINNIAIFNEKYVENIVFDENEVIKDSFNVFIKSENYDNKVNKINLRLKNLKVDLLGDEKVGKLIGLLSDVSSKLVLTRSGELKKNPFLKSIVTEKNLYNIPTQLEKYTTFIKENPNNIEWIDWKTRGQNYDDICGCPFCASALPDNYEDEKRVFSTTYKKSSANNLKSMLVFFEDLIDYIKEDKYEVLVKCIKEVEDTTTIELELKKFTIELHYLCNKLTSINEFDSFSIKQSDIVRLADIIKSLYITSDTLDVFTSETTLSLIKSINDKILEIENEVQQLKAEVGQIKGIIEATVKKYKKDINSFLESAGINYAIDIIVNGDNNANTILKYIGNGSSEEVDSIKKHLSWGEKNAFALVLFMFDAIRKNPDLVILDDPISSFDNHKKYAIIQRLFTHGRQNESFYKKTVLMLTHDFEPVIDFIVNNKPTGGFVNAKFIRNSNGTITEKEIIKNNGVESYVRMLARYAKKENLNNVSRVVFLRQLIEHIQINEEEVYAYNLLSSLIHGDENPMIKIDGEPKREASKDVILKGTEFIKSYISDFEYYNYKNNHFNKDRLEQLYNSGICNYLKLQIFRTYIAIVGFRDRLADDVFLKFIDEIYHIENDYIYYLDLLEFDIVPSYILEKGDKFFNSIASRQASR